MIILNHSDGQILENNLFISVNIPVETITIERIETERESIKRILHVHPHSQSERSLVFVQRSEAVKSRLFRSV